MTMPFSLIKVPQTSKYVLFGASQISIPQNQYFMHSMFIYNFEIISVWISWKEEAIQFYS